MRNSNASNRKKSPLNKFSKASELTAEEMANLRIEFNKNLSKIYTNAPEKGYDPCIKIIN